MQRSLLHAEHQLMAVGAMAFIGFPLFYWVWTEVFPQHYETLGLRLLGSLLGLGLMLTPFWAKAWKEYLPLYWFVTILYTLSFFFAFSVLKNNASVISSMSMLCAVFLLVLLVDIFSLIFMVLIGWGAAFFCYYVSTDVINLNGFHLQYFMVFLFTLVTGSVFNYKTALLQQQRLEGMAMAAGMIAHELRTPLLGIKSGAQALNQTMPQLVDAYQQAKEHNLTVQPARSSRIKSLALVTERIISEIHYANTIIDILLLKSGQEQRLKHIELVTCSMAECLSVAIERYPFQSQHERELISCRGDFNFQGSTLLIEHVLFNLIKNSLYFIAQMQKGTIVIWTKETRKWSILHYKDTAKGISKDELSKLFQPFHTTTYKGTGIGLSFCKMVMTRLGGDIRCESIEGEFTEFILSFPKS